MKALVYHGAGEKRWEEVPDPTILAPTDAIVRIEATTICGTDLHPQGRCPGRDRGAHPRSRGCRVITEVGGAVTDLAVGTA